MSGRNGAASNAPGVTEATLIGRLRSRLCQSALLNDEACDLIDTLTTLQIGKNERALCAHSQRIRFHYLKVCADQRSQIDLVDDEKIGARNTRAALARYFFTCCDVDHIDRQIGQLGTEGCRKII